MAISRGLSLSVYRNGMTQFKRKYTLQSSNPERIPLPVLEQHIDPLYATIQPFGDVAITQPLQHSNPQEEHSRIQINGPDHGGLYTYLANNFAGAAVRINRRGLFKRSIVGTLVWTASAAATKRASYGSNAQFLLEAKGGVIVPVPFVDVTGIELLDKAERELFQSLVENCRRQRRDNFIEAAITVQGTEGTELAITYCLPGNPPEFMYRLIHEPAKQNSLVLVGQVRVTNSFADDWDDVEISLPTTQPKPIRGGAQAVGYERQERRRQGYDESQTMMTMMPNQFESNRPFTRARNNHVAHAAEANVEELGDAHVFQVQGKISLPAGASAMPLLFQLDMEAPEPILYVSGEVQRGFRFRFTGNFIAPTAPCVVYSGTTVEGEGQLKLSRPRQRRIVCHAVQQGVMFGHHDSRGYTTTLACLGNDDELTAKVRHRHDTQYRIENRTGKKQTLVFEQRNSFPGQDTKLSCSPPGVKAHRHGDGWRFTVNVTESLEPTLVVITEVYNEVRTVRMHAQGVNLADWLAEFIFQSDEPSLCDSKQFRPIRESIKKIKGARDQISRAQREKIECQRRIDSYNQSLIAIGHADGKESEKTDLIAKITEYQEKIEQLDRDIKTQTDEIEEESRTLLDLMRNVNLGKLDDPAEQTAGASAVEA